MKTIIGTVSSTGSLAARASKRVSISVRISADNVRSAWASGVPYCIVCTNVVPSRLRLSSPVRAPMLCKAVRRSDRIRSSVAVCRNTSATAG